MKPQGIAILGSTGSIGVSTLEVIARNLDQYQVVALSGNSRIAVLAEQALRFRPFLIALGLGKTAEFMSFLPPDYRPRIEEGEAGLIAVAQCEEATQVVVALVGACGIRPVLAAIAAKKRVALANKESIVMAGSLVMAGVRNNKVVLLPIDSEHNAIFQALQGSERKDVAHITLTASGGPFRQLAKEEFASITKERALKHPNWSMGAKITIDSATMMNKALEIIEAHWLFDLKAEQIKVVVHPESILHSLVAYKDGSLIAQMGTPDMRTPIAYCLAFPQRIASGVAPLDMAQLGALHFQPPDLERFPSIAYAYQAIALGGGAPAALNGANEVLVELFLQDQIPFMRILSCLGELMERLKQEKSTTGSQFPWTLDTLDQALAADQWGRKFAQEQAPC